MLLMYDSIIEGLIAFSIQNRTEFRHYGVGHLNGGHSGRYPYGSGKRSRQRDSSLRKVTSLSNRMKRDVSYSNYTTLKSPEETVKSGKGSCHDQVMYELDELKKLGIKANARFLIEYNSKSNAGGTTRSFVYFNHGGKTVWLENAWKGKEGVHEFSSLKDIESYITSSRQNGEWGDKNSYDKVEFSDFKPDKHKYGESLQELVDICLDD